MEGLALVGVLVFSIALSFCLSALLGVGASWVLAHFGVHVAWYVCSVAIFIIGSIFRAGGSSK